MKLFHLILACTVLATTTVSYAETTYYDIEIIVFEDTTGHYLTSERWPASQALISDDIKTKNSRRATKRLGGVASKLKASDRYNVLVHRAWRERGLDANSAKATSVKSSASSGSSIEGSVKIVLGRFLHFYADLNYHRLTSGSSNGVLPEYKISSHRRMRSQELHYIDHPLVGILVKATPVETS